MPWILLKNCQLDDIICDVHDNNIWLKLFPVVHQALANPKGKFYFPNFTTEPDFEFNFNACAYWEAASYIVHILLGWSDPAKGVYWLLNNQDQASQDLRLKLLLDVWNSSGQLGLLLAWYASGYRDHGQWYGAPQSNTPFKTEMTTEWWAAFQEKWPYSFQNTPCFGGYNSLHLHANTYCLIFEEFSEQPPIYYSRPDRKAVLMLNTMNGWHSCLRQIEKWLPKLQGQSWYVDVVVKPLGWLGTFRRSRKTGLWFLGKHGIHVQGN